MTTCLSHCILAQWPTLCNGGEHTRWNEPARSRGRLSPSNNSRVRHVRLDGGIIGRPAWEPGTPWLYLSGEEAGTAAACFSDGPLQAVVIGEEPGQASALKMCYAAWTKGRTALLCAILATAGE